jgi:IPT/TIG domain/Divergent InlB B-repeat domain
VRSHAKASSAGSSSGARARLPRRNRAAILALAFVALLLIPSLASAASRTHETAFPTSEEPSVIAVDESNGDVYVGDVGGIGSVSRYDSSGAPKNFTCEGCSGNTLSGFFLVPGAGQVAVDSNSGRIYITAPFSLLVEVFDNTGEHLATLDGTGTPNHTFAVFPCGVAVDQSTGDVYVGDYGGFVWRYTPSGGDIEESDYSGAVATPMPTCNVAAAQGVVYASNSLELGDVRAYADADFADTEPPPSPPSTLIDTGATAIYADSATADLYADKGSAIDVSDHTGADLYSFGSGDFGSSSGVAAMPSLTGKAYVSDPEGDEVDVYGPASTEPGFQLDIQKTGNGSGTVKSSPLGINCKLRCSTEFEDGEVVELEATPAPDSEFAGWSTVAGDPGTCIGTTSPCEVTMEGAVELEAEFALPPVPAVEALLPSEGSTAGELVEIEGSGLAHATKVQFGSVIVNAPFIEDTATTIKVKAPGHSAGTVDVLVTTPGGTSPDTAADDYTYVAPPAVTALSPANGPTSGGNQVEISGLRLSEASKVEFGTTEVTCPSVDCVLEGATKIKVAAPAHAAGKVNVKVTSVGGSSGNFAEDDYTYVVPPPASLPGAGTGTPPAPDANLPPPVQCVVPKLKGLSTAKARSALSAAHCKAGDVSKPRSRKGRRTGPLVVKASKPGAGATLPANGEVDLTLGPKPRVRK